MRASKPLWMAEKLFFDNYVELEGYILDQRTRIYVSKEITKKQIYFIIKLLKPVPGNEDVTKQFTEVLKALKKYTFVLPGEVKKSKNKIMELDCEHEWINDSFDHFGFLTEQVCNKCNARQSAL
jgi:hypothetical protein